MSRNMESFACMIDYLWSMKRLRGLQGDFFFLVTKQKMQDVTFQNLRVFPIPLSKQTPANIDIQRTNSTTHMSGLCMDRFKELRPHVHLSTNMITRLASLCE